MSVFTMVVLIVFIVTMGRLYESRQKALRRPDSSSENRRLEAEVTRLNERIAVLERLATDPSRRLSDEIDSLKSLPSKNAPEEQGPEEDNDARR